MKNFLKCGIVAVSTFVGTIAAIAVAKKIEALSYPRSEDEYCCNKCTEEDCENCSCNRCPCTACSEPDDYCECDSDSVNAKAVNTAEVTDTSNEIDESEKTEAEE